MIFFPSKTKVMVTLVIKDGRQIFQKIPDSLEKLVDYLEENKAR